VSIVEELHGILVDARGASFDNMAKVGSEDGILQVALEHLTARYAGLADGFHRSTSLLCA
jgi:hypothetical protein